MYLAVEETDGKVVEVECDAHDVVVAYGFPALPVSLAAVYVLDYHHPSVGCHTAQLQQYVLRLAYVRNVHAAAMHKVADAVIQSLALALLARFVFAVYPVVGIIRLLFANDLSDERVCPRRLDAEPACLAHTA